MVKLFSLKSPDEWATTKQACRDTYVVTCFLASTIRMQFVMWWTFWNLNTWPNSSRQFWIQTFYWGLERLGNLQRFWRSGCLPKILWFQNTGYLKLGDSQLGVNDSWQNASKLTEGSCKSTLVKSSRLSASITWVKSWMASSIFDISVYIVPLRAKALR